MTSTTFSFALHTFPSLQQFTIYDYTNWRTERIISINPTRSNLRARCFMSYLSTPLLVVATSLRSIARAIWPKLPHRPVLDAKILDDFHFQQAWIKMNFTGCRYLVEPSLLKSLFSHFKKKHCNKFSLYTVYYLHSTFRTAYKILLLRPGTGLLESLLRRKSCLTCNKKNWHL